MPGIKGEKMIPRLSVSKKFHSVRELVFSILEKTPTISKEECDKLVKKEYPLANFLGKDGRSGHFTWYKHKWNRMKLENANFNIKEAHPKAEKEEAIDGDPISNESPKDSSTRVEDVVDESVGQSRNRGKGGRISVQPKKRRVVIKARKVVLQRKGSPKNSGQPTKDQKVPN